MNNYQLTNKQQSNKWWMISFIIYLLSFSMAFTSCADDDLKGYVPEASSIRIVQNDLLFSAEGSSSIVIVEADGMISASTDADWCQATVSGRTVTVAVDRNTTFSGRTALLTISAGDARRQLPVQQQGMVLDLPLTTTSHYSPIGGDEFSLTIHHSLPVDATSPQSWIHPVMEGNTLRITVDSNVGGHIRRGVVVCACGDYRDTLRIGQYDMQNDVIGSYYLMGYYGGNGGTATATRFDILLRNDSLFMHWPQEHYADAYVHLPFDRPSCTLFIPSGFTLYEDERSIVNGFFYDTNGRVATAAGAGVNAQLYYSESTGYNTARPVMANWPGHELSGFILRNTSIVSTTLLQLASPVLLRVGPAGTTLDN